MTPIVEQAATEIANRAGGIIPKIGIVLGSGLDDVVDLIEEPVAIDYRNIPGFPALTLHKGQLVIGRVAGTPVACLVGRAHYYEGLGADAMSVPVRTLGAIGCETLLITNAAGSLREEAGPWQFGVDHRPHKFRCGKSIVRSEWQRALRGLNQRLRPDTSRPLTRRRQRHRHCASSGRLHLVQRTKF